MVWEDKTQIYDPSGIFSYLTPELGKLTPPLAGHLVWDKAGLPKQGQNQPPCLPCSRGLIRMHIFKKRKNHKILCIHSSPFSLSYSFLS